ncbi:MAG: molybdopterin-dependent oxidoreductase [Bacteroidales bacterium]|nr:molybdopterin-dependent oxidoreductase [Bacteroidales bacterium]
MPEFSTACPRNCYSTCSFKAHVENGKLVSIAPHPDNLATAEGPCIKGLSYVERVQSKDRILYPLKKNQHGKFERINWEEAVQIIADKLQFLKEKFGPQSVLFYESSGMSGLTNGFSSKFWELYGGATTTYGNLCWPAGLEAVRLTLGENKHNVPWDLEHAKLIILWGKNPAETNIHQMVFIEKAQAKGAKLVVIDPRRTASSDRADLILQPQPGTDAAIALSLANFLIQNKKYDKAFVENNVFGFEEFKTSVKEWTLAKAAEISKVPLQFLEELANDLATTKPMTVIPGYGMQRFSNGGQTVRALLSLSVITGNIGKVGACFHYANLQSYIFDKVKEPQSYYPEIEVNPVFRRTVSKAKLGRDMLAQQNPPLKMIWVERGNPITQNPDTALSRKAIRKLDFRVVVEQFMTDTALEADIILPAKSMFEQSDVIGSYWNPYVQLKPKILEFPGEVKPETEIYFALAHILGFSNKEIEKFLLKKGDKYVEDYLKDELKPFKTLDWEQLKAGPVLAPGMETIAFVDKKFKTPSGKIELFSAEAAEKWKVSALPSFEALESNEFPFFLLSPNTKNRIHSQFGNLKLIKQFASEPTCILSAEDALKKGIKKGDKIKIYNANGSLISKVDISFGLKAGCIVYYNGWWMQEGGSPNILTSGKETDMGHGTAFHDTKVQIEKVSNKQSLKV